MNRITTTAKPFVFGLIPISADYQKIPDKNANKENANQNLEAETGWDRVKKVFQPHNETGGTTKELDLICTYIGAGALVGIAFGGLMGTRHVAEDFIDRNMATRFVSNRDAKRRLRDHVVINFAKGARVWCPKFTLFSAIYGTSTILLNAYSGKATLTNFVIGGMLAGAILKANMGIPGIVAGSIASGFVTGVANGIILLTMKLTGITFEDVLNRQKPQYDSVPKKSADSETTTENQ